jgi:hypothetical protein
MKSQGHGFQGTFRRWTSGAVLAGIVPLGFFESCDNRAANITSYVDPCGTVLGNCTPGSFQVNAADVGDYCIDPACTVPGQCGGGQPLGTITRICP